MADANEARWLQALEEKGTANVRILLSAIGAYNTGGGGIDVLGVVSQAPHPPRNTVEAWLARKERAASRRNSVILVASLIAAVSGVIAAIEGWR